MTQEELDELMSGNVDLQSEEFAEDSVDENSAQTEEKAPELTEDNYGKVHAGKHWPPPPPTEDNKPVDQLDDVTRESEQKASEIFDIIEQISNNLMDSEESLSRVKEVLSSNVETLQKLKSKFPEINTFAKMLEENKDIHSTLNSHSQMLQTSGDDIMSVMDIMQYQDIHRQKIERVINVMRALSVYMNKLFSSKIEDEKRVSSAVHIDGDTNTQEVVGEEEIEALLAQFGEV